MKSMQTNTLANARNRCSRELGQLYWCGVWPPWVQHTGSNFVEDVFQAADFRGGLTAKWSSADAKRVREGGYTELDVELALDCEDGRFLMFLGELGVGKHHIEAYSYYRNQRFGAWWLWDDPQEKSQDLQDHQNSGLDTESKPGIHR